jgi:catechol 2,3-dioxygenase-like lactoylglutathione lyase family enzyme
VFSHIFVGVTDFDRSFAFYNELMKLLGNGLRFHDREKQWACWHSGSGGRPLFVMSKPYDGQAHNPGNGQMVAFMATSREVVRQAYLKSLALGGAGEGPPGLRPQYHEHYYGAYVRDPDGNKLCIVCHAQE